MDCHTVLGSCKTVSSEGRRLPTTRGRVDGVLGARFGRLVDHRVQAKRSDQRHLLSDTMQSQFQDTVGGISYELDGHRGKPTTQQAYHLMCSHTHSLVTFSQLLADFRGRCQNTLKGQGPTLLRPGQRDHYGHDDPA